MIRILSLLLGLSLAVPALAADRVVATGSFDRIRVEGPFDVTLTTGRSPGGRITGDARAIDGVEIRVDGGMLVVARGSGAWGERPQGAVEPVRITLSTPGLVSASVLAGGRLAIDRMKGARIDLSLSGAGAVTLAAADTDQLNAIVVGAGAMTIAGRAARARLLTSGPGTIDAGKLDVGDLVVRLDGMGETKATARLSAIGANVGLGRITITGAGKCSVKAIAGGPVTCGR